ncbi:transposase [Cognatishimia sp. F0-27]|nr:transposase [Cognatishimia sp. F0-27]
MAQAIRTNAMHEVNGNTPLLPSLRHSCRMIAEWRADYYHNRPHSSLAGLTPHKYPDQQRKANT